MLAARRGGRRMTARSGTSLDLAGAASALVSSSVIEVETDRGDTIELWTIASDGDTVSASGPRLAVADGMKLTCRLVGDRGVQTVSAVVEAAEYRSAARASLRLRIVDVAIEEYQRRAPRLSVRAAATLRATVSDRVVPGESLAITMVDLSESGVGLTTTDDRLRAGDRFMFTSRFLEGAIIGEVRVAYVAQSSSPGVFIAGCFFLDRAAAGRRHQSSAGAAWRRQSAGSRFGARRAGAGRAGGGGSSCRPVAVSPSRDLVAPAR